jgi:hypothetical protein
MSETTRLEAQDEVVLICEICGESMTDGSHTRKCAEERYEDDAENHSSRWMRDQYGDL